MIEININNISINFGYKKILDKISFEIKTKEIVSIIGDNGCGKSTILNLINKDILPDEGKIQIKKDSKIGYLKQNIELKSNIKVIDFLYENVSEILDIENKMREYEMKLSNCNKKELNILLKKYGNLQEKYENLGGYNISSKINKIVTGFKIEKHLYRDFNNLSGGEKKIVYLASIMIKNPEILLLDEPTNHLDIETISWFENYLKNYNGTVILISHDRYFLDKVATKTILIESGKNYIYHGNYSYYVKENEERIEKEFKEYKNQKKLIFALNKKIKQLDEFGRRAFPGGEPFFKRADNIRKRLERIEMLDKPQIKKDLNVNFEVIDRSGKEVLVIDNYDLKIEEKVLIKDINIKIIHGDKICIMGKNGCGKTTLIKNIIGNSDSNIKIGSNVKIGYIPQDIKFEKNVSVLDYAKKCFDGEEYQLRSALNKFYFHHDNVFRKVNTLSGGEKVRLKIFELIQAKCNFLILDEPTNHIDISTRELLESSLKEYKGTLLFISHDRYFINNVASKILYIKEKKMIELVGNYETLENNFFI